MGTSVMGTNIRDKNRYLIKKCNNVYVTQQAHVKVAKYDTLYFIYSNNWHKGFRTKAKLFDCMDRLGYYIV